MPKLTPKLTEEQTQQAVTRLTNAIAGFIATECDKADKDPEIVLNALLNIASSLCAIVGYTLIEDWRETLRALWMDKLDDTTAQCRKVLN